MNRIFTIFPRLNNRRKWVNASVFQAAGYPMAIPASLGPWQEMHWWCAEHFRDSKGITYCWTGEKFWFQNEADRQKFIEKWGSCSAPLGRQALAARQGDAQ